MGVVLSACKGVTDSLLALVSQAERRDAVWRDGLIALRQRHEHIATSLLTRAAVDAYLAGIDRDLQDLEGILQAVSLTRSASRNVTDLISGYGEIWSTRLFRDFYASSGKRSGEVRWLDAREVVVVEWGPLGPMVQWQESQRRIKAAIPAEFEGTLIITGFIAADARGVQTTLGRNGSDFRHRSSGRCSMRVRFIFGRTSMACCRPIRVACRMRRSSIRCPITKRWSWHTSVPR